MLDAHANVDAIDENGATALHLTCALVVGWGTLPYWLGPVWWDMDSFVPWRGASMVKIFLGVLQVG